jgi:CheY-like chemotaxis protein
VSEAPEEGAPQGAVDAPSAAAPVHPDVLRWVLLTALLATLKFEVVPGRSLSPMGLGLVLTAALHGPLAGGAAGVAAGLMRALTTGQQAFVPALPLSGLAIGWAAPRLPLPLAGITLAWVALSSAPLMGASSMLSGASDAASLSAAARALLDGLAMGMLADLAYPHLRGAWGPRPERRLEPLRQATYVGMLLTSAGLAGALEMLHFEHAQLRAAAHRVDIEHMRAHAQASATDIGTWLTQGRQVAHAAAREVPGDLPTFAAGAHAVTPDLVGLVIEAGGAPVRAWARGACPARPATADLEVAPMGRCPVRGVARVQVVGETRVTVWLDLGALASRIRAWTWVRELDDGRAWVEDGAGRTLIRNDEDAAPPKLPEGWIRTAILPDIDRWTPPGKGGPSLEARAAVSETPWVARVLVPPGARFAAVEAATLRGLARCFGLGLLGFLVLPLVLRAVVPERDAPMVATEEDARDSPRRSSTAPAEPRHQATWSDLVDDAVEAAARAAGVERSHIDIQAPPEGLPGAPAPMRALGRSLHLLLDEALGASGGPWTILLETCASTAGEEAGVVLTLLDPRPPPSHVELGALDRPVERAGNHQALALARHLGREASVRLVLDGKDGCRRTRLVLGEGSAPTVPPPPPPREEPAKADVGALPPSTPPSGPRQARILLAEDNEANRLLIQALLSSRGWTCDAVVGATEAVEAVATGRYGLVLMDLHMPDIDGLEATRRIRKCEGSTAGTPVVAITADLVEGTRERCLSAGMDDFLTKPVELDTLAEVVERFVGKPEAEEEPREQEG